MLHGRTEIAGLQPKLYKTLQKMASKTTSYTHEINGLRVVQGELKSFYETGPEKRETPTPSGTNRQRVLSSVAAPNFQTKTKRLAFG